MLTPFWPRACRDLKSSNVLLSADGTSAKVADIGSAALLDASQLGAELTSTLAWAAPELLAADRNSVVDDKVRARRQRDLPLNAQDIPVTCCRQSLQRSRSH